MSFLVNSALVIRLEEAFRVLKVTFFGHLPEVDTVQHMYAT